MYRQLRERGIRPQYLERAAEMNDANADRLLNLITEDPTLSSQRVGMVYGME